VVNAVTIARVSNGRVGHARDRNRRAREAIARRNRASSLGTFLVCRSPMTSLRSFIGSSLCVVLAFAIVGCVACSSSGSDSSSGDGGGDAHVLDVTPLDTPPADAAEPRHVKCGRTDVCDLSIADCCAGTGGTVCIPRGGDCDGYRVACDGPEDCSSPQICCLTRQVGQTAVLCSAPEGCVTEVGLGNTVCHVDADCASAPSGPHCCFFGLGGVLVGTCQASTCP
jgi:hypothetical protein